MAINPDGVFGKQTHDPCLTDDCQGRTQHKSGYCEKCRTRVCAFCKDVFVCSKQWDLKQNLCAQCRRSTCRR